MANECFAIFKKQNFSKENYEIWKSKYGKGGTKGSFNSYVNRIIKDLGYKLNLQKR